MTHKIKFTADKSNNNRRKRHHIQLNSLMSTTATYICVSTLFHQNSKYPISLCLSSFSNCQRMLLGGTSFPATLKLKTTGLQNLNKFTVSASTAATSFSVSDTTLDSRGFILHRTTSDLNLDHLNTVFVAVGFPRRDKEKIKIALENTDVLVWLQDKKTQKPVAFGRATGDGVFNAIIWDVVVDPSFQGFGLGKAVMERLIDDLLARGIGNIALYSEPRVVGFYRPLGFVADPDGIRGMVYSRKPKK